MSLPAGTRLSGYEIAGPLGSGAMGDVYRARDTNLNHQVAIKILPDSFVNNPRRVARIVREAKTLAALDDAHIARIHGFERWKGAAALVIELVDGPTLADCIAEKPIPLDEALAIAREIAEALEAAHEVGIIHRNLKPANIKVKSDGTVKVLDFGLAKLAQISRAISDPLAMTPRGVTLGTAAYMAPEQARGKAVDKRADIWAFGCVFYEMLTAKRAFSGKDEAKTVAAVLMDDPDWNELPAHTPASMRKLLDHCLAKDPLRRLGDIRVARLEIENASDDPIG
jgi:serine/threonine protein kinase